MIDRKHPNILNSAKFKFADWLASKEPVDTARVVPAILQEEFEETISFVVEQATVMECHIEKGIYYINVEHSGVRPGMGATPLKVIPRISLALRRFYQKNGVMVQKNEVHIMYSSTGLAIEIALNNYGLKEIRRRNYEQVKFLRQKYGR